jgi:glycosyltransferase involved in cell wall biosynthesis
MQLEKEITQLDRYQNTGLRKLTEPLISLLVANFNNGEFIEETLQSAVNQTYPNIEIIVIDDASTDNSVEKIKAFIEKNHAANIHFFENEYNSGGCGSIKNQCIAVSKGEYFAFLDPEDTIELSAVEQLMSVHLQNPEKYSIVYCTHWLCNARLEPQSVSTWVGKIPDGQSHLTSTGGHISAFAVCNRKLYDKTLGINQLYYVAEDQDLYLKMEEIATVFYIDKPLYYYRKHDHNTSWNDQRRHRNLYWFHEAENEAYRRRKNDKTAAINFTKSQIDKKNLGYHLQMGKFYRKNSEYFNAAKEYFRAIPYLLL